MYGGIDKLLEAIRQRALVRSGRLFLQVECRGPHDAGWALCVFCGAQL